MSLPEIPLVVPMAFCRWEGATLPLDHPCIADSGISCNQRGDDGQVCGTCTSCRDAQVAALAPQSEEIP